MYMSKLHYGNLTKNYQIDNYLVYYFTATALQSLLLKNMHYFAMNYENGKTLLKDEISLL